MLIVKEQKFVQEDKMGNFLYMRVFLDETNTQRSANIHLKLNGEDRQRFIGNYHFDNNTMYLKRPLRFPKVAETYFTLNKDKKDEQRNTK
jgi:hypothetical protein